MTVAIISAWLHLVLKHLNAVLFWILWTFDSHGTISLQILSSLKVIIKLHGEKYSMKPKDLFDLNDFSNYANWNLRSFFVYAY